MGRLSNLGILFAVLVASAEAGSHIDTSKCDEAKTYQLAIWKATNFHRMCFYMHRYHTDQEWTFGSGAQWQKMETAYATDWAAKEYGPPLTEDSIRGMFNWNIEENMDDGYQPCQEHVVISQAPAIYRKGGQQIEAMCDHILEGFMAISGLCNQCPTDTVNTFTEPVWEGNIKYFGALQKRTLTSGKAVSFRETWAEAYDTFCSEDYNTFIKEQRTLTDAGRNIQDFEADAWREYSKREVPCAQHVLCAMGREPFCETPEAASMSGATAMSLSAAATAAMLFPFA